MIDNVVLTNQDKTQQKGFKLTKLASKQNIGLIVQHVEKDKIPQINILIPNHS